MATKSFVFVVFWGMLASVSFAAKSDGKACKTRIVLCSDTEDYICNRANDGIRDFANALTEEGVREPVEVSRKGLVEAAAKIDLSAFLPPSIEVDGKRIGPAFRR